nr:hypothetical protein [Acidobacteriota bacterium]
MIILIALLQTALLPFAGIGMYRLWKRLASAGKWIELLVALGFLARAGLGLLLFWLSYLPIPLPANAADNNGLWFFAWDGHAYFMDAAGVALKGPSAILHLSSGVAAAFFIKILSTFLYVFGSVASVALLLNCLAFLLTCAAIQSISPRATRTTTLAIGALSLCPSLILWSLQPLKDVFFLTMVAAFMALAFALQKIVAREGLPSLLRSFAIALALAGLTYGIAGIRWYFAFLLWALCAPFGLMTIARSRTWKAAAMAALVFVVCGMGFFAGGGVYVPEPIQNLARPAAALRAAGALPKFVLAGAADVRLGFERTVGNTTIAAAPETPVQAAVVPAAAKSVPPAPPAPPAVTQIAATVVTTTAAKVEKAPAQTAAVVKTQERAPRPAEQEKPRAAVAVAAVTETVATPRVVEIPEPVQTAPLAQAARIDETPAPAVTDTPRVATATIAETTVPESSTSAEKNAESSTSAIKNVPEAPIAREDVAPVELPLVAVPTVPEAPRQAAVAPAPKSAAKKTIRAAVRPLPLPLPVGSAAKPAVANAPKPAPRAIRETASAPVIPPPAVTSSPVVPSAPPVSSSPVATASSAEPLTLPPTSQPALVTQPVVETSTTGEVTQAAETSTTGEVTQAAEASQPIAIAIPDVRPKPVAETRPEPSLEQPVAAKIAPAAPVVVPQPVVAPVPAAPAT